MINDYNKPAEQKNFNNQQKEMDALSNQYDTYIKLTGKFLELKAIHEQMRENNKAPGKTGKQ